MNTILQQQLIKQYGSLKQAPAEVVRFCQSIDDEFERESCAKDLDALKDKFISIIARQFRQPLGAMRWSLDALLMGEVGTLTEAQQKFVRMAREADAELMRRVADLLAALDLEEGRMDIAKDDVSLETLWASVQATCQKQCQAKQIVFTYQPSTRPLPRLKADADKIRAVMEKIVENSLSYTPDKGHIVVKMNYRAPRVRFEVTDTGIGIPEREQDRVFTRFFRGANASILKPAASGLSLFIAKQYVDLHGGRIGFTSREQDGSTFWFELNTR